MYIIILVSGFAGGALRGLVGFLKHQLSYKKIEFKWPYFLSTTALSGIVGLVTAIIAKESGISFVNSDFITPALAFVVGYAGGDFLESIYKIIVKKPA